MPERTESAYHLKPENAAYVWMIKRHGKAKAHLLYVGYVGIDGAVQTECQSWIDYGTDMVPATIYDSICKVCVKKHYPQKAMVRSIACLP